ncbi:hypothetical protein LLE49_22405 [Alicyclobacillus tolerans]|uniref:homing endonuclease associated repeat-containing protein n=1 Tax=Alicyclobacillus tolerans TaxID=90970 RepID=UPI0023518BAC|nr:hypothetical protein [Alicyclobacillus tolerans]MCF8567475.1 hypothetical protein [Alicyclobacillus tolerans]
MPPIPEQNELKDLKKSKQYNSDKGTRTRWTEALIISRIREVHATGRPLNRRSMDNGYSDLVIAARRHFGSWDAAIQAAGLVLTRVKKPRKKWTDERIVEAIRIRIQEEKPVNYKAVATEEEKLIVAGRRNFGSWKAALQAAGVTKQEVDRLRPPRKKTGLIPDSFKDE